LRKPDSGISSKSKTCLSGIELGMSNDKIDSLISRTLPTLGGK